MRRALVIVALLASGCTTTTPPTPTPDPGLSDRLLTTGDLPAGYTKHRPEPQDRPKSDHPECEEVLHDLEIATTVREARDAFQSADGTIVQHIVRDRGGPTLADTAATLTGCAQFTLTYPDGMTGTETVTTLSTTPTRWSGEVIADLGALVVHDRLTVLVEGDRTAVLSVVTPDGADESFVAGLVDTAHAKLTG
ncbi:hypothetical protein [Umezawaea sp. NPDC059074]|uniref:hypothetical protein n=1 Tax=Umezawaea sp. NPDC059074 TaxID=3346716 RepID=UPI0036B7EFE4